MILYVKKKYNSKNMSSESLAKQALALYMNEKNASASYDAEDFSIQRTEKGKPYAKSHKDRAPHFSVSHTGEIWGCLVSEENIGLDIQLERENVAVYDIAKRFFSKEEQQLVQEEGREGFFKAWTAREAYGKYTGKGFFTDKISAGEKDEKVLSAPKKGLGKYYLEHITFPGQYIDGKVYCAICSECKKDLKIVEI